MLVVMMYHYVHKEDDHKLFHNLKGISIKEFELQLEYLLKNYEPINHEDLISYFIDNKPLPSKAFYLTFDDGFKQHIINVLPILKKYGLEGSFFVPTMPLIDKKIHFLEKQRLVQYSIYNNYTDFLILFYEYAKKYVEKTYQINPTKINIESKKTYLSQYGFYTKEERFYRYIRDEVLDTKVCQFIIEEIFAKYFDEKEVVKNYYLDVDDLKELQKEGMIIGGHSHSHPFLEKIIEEELEKELECSLNYLSEYAGCAINSFSYPFGTYNKKVINQLKKFNIQYSFTTMDLINGTSIEEYSIKRIDASSFDRVVRDDILK